jgi:hypothetical protein
MVAMLQQLLGLAQNKLLNTSSRDDHGVGPGVGVSHRVQEQGSTEEEDLQVAQMLMRSQTIC